MTKYKINIDLINKVVPATSTEQARYWLNGVYIHDTDGIRNYVATNGHILFKASEMFEGETLKEPLILKINKPLKNKYIKNGEMTIVDKDTVVIKHHEKTVCDIIDGTFPEYQRLFDSHKGAKPIEEYVLFAPEYMAELKKFMPENWTDIPLMVGNESMGQWHYEDVEGVNYTALLMPVRIKRWERV